MYDFLGHLMVHPQKEKIASYLLFILLSGTQRGRGVVRIVISEILNKEEGVLNSKHGMDLSGPTHGIEVHANIWSKFSVHGLPWTTSSSTCARGLPSLVLILASILLSGHRAVVCRIVNWNF